MHTTKQISWVILAAAVTAFGGCGGGASTENTDDTESAFVASADDELIDPNDPPTDPDPVDSDDSTIAAAASVSVATTNGGGAAATATCVPRHNLSPKGLTFVFHISNRNGNADRALQHLKTMHRYVRARDIFMVEERSDMIDRLHDAFPCNRIHFIAFPDQMKAALATGDRVDGIAVDWEGGAVEANSQAYSEARLHDYVQAIRKAGKQPGFVPAWSPRFNDAAVTNASNMDYELAQIQGACVNGASNFARNANGMLHDFHARGLGLRNIGFEISMDSFDVASNHVDAQRSAACTRAAYGKGARAIYIYGNGQDELPNYLHALGKMGVRTAR